MAVLAFLPAIGCAFVNMDDTSNGWPEALDEARYHFETALQIRPSDPAASYNLERSLAGQSEHRVGMKSPQHSRGIAFPEGVITTSVSRLLLGDHFGMVILMIIRRTHSRRIIAVGLCPGAAGNAEQKGQGE
jgi:hypothetical protein